MVDIWRGSAVGEARASAPNAGITEQTAQAGTYQEGTNLMMLTGRVALVTGASRGIGREIALALAAAGADIGCVATTAANAQSVADEITQLGRRAIPIGCRVEDSRSVTEAFRAVADQLGSIDILINNAGVSRPKPILDMSDQDWDLHLDTNAKSVFLCSQAAARSMIAGERPGSIINIGSIAGQNAFPQRLAYCASKAALDHMTRVMAIEWAEHEIRVNCIAPGYIRTDMVGDLISQGILDASTLTARIPQRRLGSPQDVANAVVFLASPAAGYITGSVLTVDGGWHAYGFV